MKPILHGQPSASRGLVSTNLLVVLAVILAGVGGLAYEWYHAQAMETQRISEIARHHKKCAVSPADTH